MNNIHLEKLINKYLNNNSIKDCAFNGLQIQGINKIKKIYTGVDISLELIKKSIINHVNAIIVHHGIFWEKEELNLIGIKKKKIKKILENNINLYAWHLPLDIHNNIGNNVLLAKNIGIEIINLPTNNNPYLIGKNKFLSEIKLIKKIQYKYPYNFNIYKNKKRKIKNIGICTGSGKNYLEKMIIKFNIDTYITGEIPENYLYFVKDYNINIITIGHYFSEILGIKKLGVWINKNFNIKVNFIIKDVKKK